VSGLSCANHVQSCLCHDYIFCVSTQCIHTYKCVYIYITSLNMCAGRCASGKKRIYSWHTYIHTSYVCVPWVYFFFKWIDIHVYTYTYITRLNMCGGCCASGGPTDVCYQYIFVWLSHIHIYLSICYQSRYAWVSGASCRPACLMNTSFFEWPHVNYIYIYIYIYIYYQSKCVGGLLREWRAYKCVPWIYFFPQRRNGYVYLYTYMYIWIYMYIHTCTYIIYMDIYTDIVYLLPSLSTWERCCASGGPTCVCHKQLFFWLNLCYVKCI